VTDEATEKQLEKIRQLKKAYIETFNTGAGPSVFKDLARKGYLNKTTFSKSAEEMAFREGQRSMVLHIQNMQKIDIEATKQTLEKQKEIENE